MRLMGICSVYFHHTLHFAGSKKCTQACKWSTKSAKYLQLNWTKPNRTKTFVNRFSIEPKSSLLATLAPGGDRLLTVLRAMKLYRPRRVYLLRSEWRSLARSTLTTPNNVRRKVRAKCPFLLCLPLMPPPKSECPHSLLRIPRQKSPAVSLFCWPIQSSLSVLSIAVFWLREHGTSRRTWP